MKKKFLNLSINIIKNNKDVTDQELEIILYGLEGIYLTITKIIIIFFIAFLLGIAKEVLLLIITYNIIRTQAFGIHASKSIYCLISSLIMFVGGTFLCKYVEIPIGIMFIISLLCCILLLFYSPADTHKRPLINRNRRMKFKFLSFFLGIVYTLIIVLFYDSFIANYLLFGMVFSVLMILPITYKIFNIPYNNYLNYNFGV